MKQNNNQSLKIGKIAPEVESAFDTHFAFNTSIYYPESTLSALAAKHPENYLKIVEEVSRVLNKPDIVCYLRRDTSYIYFRLYVGKEGFRVLGVTVRLCGHPNIWIVADTSWYTNEKLALIMKKAEFRRLSDTKRRPSKKKEKKSVKAG